MKKKSKKSLVLKILLVLLVLALLWVARIVFFVLQHQAGANETALEAMKGGGGVTVEEIPEGWLFDGPSGDTALVFYVGFRVEEAAYAPLLLLVAQESADVFLVKMPLLISYLGVGKADEIRNAYSYEHWYIAGHSMGGNAAASYALSAKNPPDGLIMLSAFLRSGTKINTRTLALYGSHDQAIDVSQFEPMRAFLPEGSEVHCIEGGNHGQFGSYGQQTGDGLPEITPEEQWREAADWIRWFIRDGNAASAPDA
ncbi:MAG: alpha/beta hydrolase [Oscillibacter sp.]|nr:alpha/beta hydrolase [Oscillibacter sp.]